VGTCERAMTYREPHWYQRLVWEMEVEREAKELAAGERVRLALLKPAICGHAPTELHLCPYKQAQPDDSEWERSRPCDCCEACTEECRADINERYELQL
jgi:hypothetical protein